MHHKQNFRIPVEAVESIVHIIMLCPVHDVILLQIFFFAEPDGSRQVSPESPIRPMVGESAPRRNIAANNEAAENSSMKLHVPPVKLRRTSEPLLRLVQ